MSIQSPPVALSGAVLGHTRTFVRYYRTPPSGRSSEGDREGAEDRAEEAVVKESKSCLGKVEGRRRPAFHLGGGAAELWSGCREMFSSFSRFATTSEGWRAKRSFLPPTNPFL